MKTKLVSMKESFFARMYNARITINKPLLAAAAVFATAVATATPSHAAVDAGLDGIVTDVTSFFADIKTLVISVVAFIIILGYAKLMKKK